jgi:hypothetical protein
MLPAEAGRIPGRGRSE